MDTKQPLVAAEVDRRARDVKEALRAREARTAMRAAPEIGRSTTTRVLRQRLAGIFGGTEDRTHPA
jgi:hypothetical protein